MAVTIAAAVEAARFFEKILHTQVLNTPNLTLLTVQSVINTMNKWVLFSSSVIMKTTNFSSFAADSLYVEIFPQVMNCQVG